MHENVFMIIFEVISYNYIHFPRVFKVQGEYLSELKKIKGSFSMVFSKKKLFQWCFLSWCFLIVTFSVVFPNGTFYWHSHNGTFLLALSQWYFLNDNLQLVSSNWYFPNGTLSIMHSQKFFPISTLSIAFSKISNFLDGHFQIFQ